MSNQIISGEQALFLTTTKDTLLAGEFCPYCYERILHHNQIGCCVFAYPCSCRQYCGTLEEPIEESRIFRHS